MELRDGINLGAGLEVEGRFSEAIALYRGLLNAHPEERKLKWRLGLLLLRDQQFDEGFRLYEARQKPPIELGFPEWQGEPVRSLVVLPEQGLGDQILFVRYVAELRRRGIVVVLFCAPSLVRLFADLADHVLPLDGPTTIPKADAWVTIGSLPHRLGLGPTPAPYLQAPRFYAGGVGLMTSTGPILANGIDRALPADLAAELQRRFHATSLHPENTGAADFQDTAAIMNGLDHIITVDTSVANLAGALGLSATVLLPYSADWRWSLADRSPWYPTLRLARQTRPGDWRSALEAAFSSA